MHQGSNVRSDTKRSTPNLSRGGQGSTPPIIFLVWGVIFEFLLSYYCFGKRYDFWASPHKTMQNHYEIISKSQFWIRNEGNPSGKHNLFNGNTMPFGLLHTKPCRTIMKLPQKLSFGPETCEIELKAIIWSCPKLLLTP